MTYFERTIMLRLALPVFAILASAVMASAADPAKIAVLIIDGHPPMAVERLSFEDVAAVKVMSPGSSA